AKPKYLLSVLHHGFLEAKPFAPHQQQSQHVAKIDFGRLRVALQAVETIHQQLIVDPRPALFVRDRHLAGPETEGAFGRTLPVVAAEILADELAVTVEQDAEKLFAGLQLASADRTAPCVGFYLIFRHSGRLR